MISAVLNWLRSFWFWVVAALFLLTFFGISSKSIIQSFYFLTSLLPIIVVTSYVVNEFLIPQYLIRKRYALFALYSTYVFIISLYMQFMVIFGAIYIFTFYTPDTNVLSNLSISTLNFCLYILILISAFIHLFGIYNTERVQIEGLIHEKEKTENSTLTVRYKRTNYTIALEDILFIESLSDYLKITTHIEEVITKERISKIAERLPPSFIRIHRSFIINKSQINSYNKEYVSIADIDLPISRTYKVDAIKQLSS